MVSLFPKELEERLDAAQTVREIAEAIAALATYALQEGYEEAYQRLMFWLHEHDISSHEDKVHKQIILTARMLDELNKVSWFASHAWDQDITARRCAKAFLHGEVVRGDPLEWIVRGGGGSVNHWYWVQLGGYMYRGGNTEEKPVKLDCREVGVSEVLSQPCQVVFKLQELYNEIRDEAMPGGATQLTLF